MTTLRKTLKEYKHSSKASGARPAGPLAHPHGIAQQPRGKKVLSISVSLCGFLTDTAAEARGLLSGTATGVTKKPGETHLLSKKNETQMNSQVQNTPKTATTQ
jgi:hypothetical protein